jgi:hypothetical protein
LESGINKSRFGTRRDFKLQGFELRAEIQGSQLGEGVGECPNCKNIQELTVNFAFRSSGKKLQATATENPVPTNWHKLDAGPFSLFAPAGWEFNQLQGVDSYVGEFVGDGVVLTSDFGRYSSGYLKKAKKPTYVIVHESIGGFPAKIASPRTPGQGITAVYFSRVSHSTELCLFGKDLTSKQQELALNIFETIRFGGATPRFVMPPPAKKVQ